MHLYRSSAVSVSFTCLLIVGVVWIALSFAKRHYDPICKCTNKIYSYNHDNLTALAAVAPFLPGASPRKGVAIYTVFCGDSSNKANVISAPSLAFPHYFISDNEATGLAAASKGWTLIGMPGNPDSDENSANLKCKLPRTLPNMFGTLDDYKYLIYVDSKRVNALAGKHEALMTEISKFSNERIAMIFNLHNLIKGDVWEEYEVAVQHQSRYRKHKLDYQRYIQNRLHNSTLSGSRLLTGCFSIRNMDNPLTAVIGMNWYSEILKSGVEDQISLSFVFDRYKRFIGITNGTIGW